MSEQSTSRKGEGKSVAEMDFENWFAELPRLDFPTLQDRLDTAMELMRFSFLAGRASAPRSESAPNYTATSERRQSQETSEVKPDEQLHHEAAEEGGGRENGARGDAVRPGGIERGARASGRVADQAVGAGTGASAPAFTVSMGGTPEGWKLVPETPTPEMIAALHHGTWEGEKTPRPGSVEYGLWSQTYRSMLAAAPSRSAAQKQEMKK